MNSWQAPLQELGRSLSETTFVVIDLETSGGSPKLGAGITEIGAVKIRGGEVLGTFQQLVNPGTSLPSFITALTGITDQMLANAPRILEVLPDLLEFLGSENETVLVAHNAPFDLGFLKSAAAMHSFRWPNYPVIDTARLARQVLDRDEVPNCKLGTLANYFSVSVTPTHRAIDDALATVEVLHALFGRLGTFEVTTLDELQNFSARIAPVQRKKRYLAATVPNAIGVYIFRSAEGSALHIGTSSNLRTKVNRYFSSNETRRNIHEILEATTQIEVIVCASISEAKTKTLKVSGLPRPN